MVSLGDKRRVAVEIYGTQYKLMGTLSKDDMQHIAQFVDQHMRMIAEKSPRMDMMRIAVLSAVRIAEQIQQLKDEQVQTQSVLEQQKVAYEGIVQQIKQVQLEAEQALEQLRVQSAQKLDRLQTQQKKEQEQAKQQTARLRIEINQLMGQVKDKQRHTEKIEDMKQSWQQQHEDEITQLRQQHQNELEQQRTEYLQTIEQTEVQYNKRLEAEQTVRQQEIEQQRITLEKQFATERSAWIVEHKQTETKFTTYIAELKAKYGRLDDQYQQLQIAYTTLPQTSCETAATVIKEKPKVKNDYAELKERRVQRVTKQLGGVNKQQKQQLQATTEMETIQQQFEVLSHQFRLSQLEWEKERKLAAEMKQDYVQLQHEYGKLQQEFNEWLDLIEQDNH